MLSFCGARAREVGWARLGPATRTRQGRVKLKLTFTEKARKSLARKRKARLTLKIVVADRSGNATTTTKRILLKR